MDKQDLKGVNGLQHPADSLPVVGYLNIHTPCRDGQPTQTLTFISRPFCETHSLVKLVDVKTLVDTENERIHKELAYQIEAVKNKSKALTQKQPSNEVADGWQYLASLLTVCREQCAQYAGDDVSMHVAMEQAEKALAEHTAQQKPA